VRTEAMHIIRVDREARIALYISYRRRVSIVSQTVPLRESGAIGAQSDKFALLYLSLYGILHICHRVRLLRLCWHNFIHIWVFTVQATCRPHVVCMFKLCFCVNITHLLTYLLHGAESFLRS
jgi:hypothetical protein